MRHTKIIATVGPACNADGVLDALIAAGVDVFRLNFSHGTHDTHKAMFDRIRRAASRAGRIVSVMQDLSGPKIRTGRLEGGGPIQLRPGDELRIAVGDFVGGEGRVSTTYAGLVKAVKPGDRLLLDDGRIELLVERTGGAELTARVIEGGPLGEHKGINAPGVVLPASALTDKDIEDVRFGISLGVDMVALSFVQSSADLLRAREVIEAAGGERVPLVAKIERPEAVAHIDDIVSKCEAVMVARGDLGLELPLEQVPRVQKEITRHARAHGVAVIVATQVLESMRSAPRPTRAEVSDAANAVDDGVDAIMLAGETAVGGYPVRAVQTLDLIIRDAESVPPLAVETLPPPVGAVLHGVALCEAAVTLALRGHADAIVAVTRAGKTARWLSGFRPHEPIYAATNNERTARALTLFRGVVPFIVAFGDDLDSTGALVRRDLLARGALTSGAVAVFVNVSPDLGRDGANFLKLQRLGA